MRKTLPLAFVVAVLPCAASYAQQAPESKPAAGRKLNKRHRHRMAVIS